MRIVRTIITIVCDQPATAASDDHGADLTVDEIVWLAENGKVTVSTATIGLDEL